MNMLPEEQHRKLPQATGSQILVPQGLPDMNPCSKRMRSADTSFDNRFDNDIKQFKKPRLEANSPATPERHVTLLHPFQIHSPIQTDSRDEFPDRLGVSMGHEFDDSKQHSSKLEAFSRVDVQEHRVFPSADLELMAVEWDPPTISFKDATRLWKDLIRQQIQARTTHVVMDCPRLVDVKDLNMVDEKYRSVKHWTPDMRCSILCLMVHAGCKEVVLPTRVQGNVRSGLRRGAGVAHPSTRYAIPSSATRSGEGRTNTSVSVGPEMLSGNTWECYESFVWVRWIRQMTCNYSRRMKIFMHPDRHCVDKEAYEQAFQTISDMVDKMQHELTLSHNFYWLGMSEMSFALKWMAAEVKAFYKYMNVLYQ